MNKTNLEVHSERDVRERRKERGYKNTWYKNSIQDFCLNSQSYNPGIYVGYNVGQLYYLIISVFRQVKLDSQLRMFGHLVFILTVEDSIIEGHYFEFKGQEEKSLKC